MSRREHYQAMRLLRNSDGVPHFTAINCLFIAYGPGHDRRRRMEPRVVAAMRAGATCREALELCT